MCHNHDNYREYTHDGRKERSFGETVQVEGKLDIPCVFLGVYAPEARQDEPAKAPGHCWPLHTCWTVRKELGA